MILFLTRETVASPRVLDTRTVPKRFLTLGIRIFPRGFTSGLFWRTVFEIPITRFSIALSPFPIALIFKPEWALPISLAPVPMAMLVVVIESSILSVSSPSARRALIPVVEQERGLDLLRVRAGQILTRLGASRPAASGALHLVIEQSELLRVSPLTYVSVQQAGGEPAFQALTAAERRMISDTLFDGQLDEARLRLINVAQGKMIRTFELDPKSISAHSRLAALARTKG